MNTDETPLAIWGSGATAPKAHRRQDVVLHAAGPWSLSVMALLKHLEAVGFEGAPRPVGDGFDADGREAITYIPGTTPHPRAWDDNAIGAPWGPSASAARRYGVFPGTYGRELAAFVRSCPDWRSSGDRSR